MRVQAHEVIKMAMKNLVLTCPGPGGSAFPNSIVLIERPHLRQDEICPGDIYALGRGVYQKDIVTDVVITILMKITYLIKAINRSPDNVLCQVENTKFINSLQSCGLI